MNKPSLIGLGILLAVSFTQFSCSKNSATPASASSGPTLYDSLGGTALVSDPANSGQQIEQGRLGIRSLVDSAIFVIAADNQINPYFTVLLAEVGSGNLSGYTALSNNLTDFFCVATGAKDFTYGGRNMTDAHNPVYNPRISMKVTAAAFEEFIHDVGVAAGQIGLSALLTTQVAALAESLQSVIVQG